MRRLTQATTVIFLLFAASSVAAADSEPDIYVSPEAVRDMQKSGQNFLFFDARLKRDYDSRHITGAALPLPLKYYNDLELFTAKILPEHPDKDAAMREAMTNVPQSAKIVAYCNRDCQASKIMAMDLRRMGFADSTAMKDGIQGWEERGFPVEGEEVQAVAAESVKN